MIEFVSAQAKLLPDCTASIYATERGKVCQVGTATLVKLNAVRFFVTARHVGEDYHALEPYLLGSEQMWPIFESARTLVIECSDGQDIDLLIYRLPDDVADDLAGYLQFSDLQDTIDVTDVPENELFLAAGFLARDNRERVLRATGTRMPEPRRKIIGMAGEPGNHPTYSESGYSTKNHFVTYINTESVQMEGESLRAIPLLEGMSGGALFLCTSEVPRLCGIVIAHERGRRSLISTKIRHLHRAILEEHSDAANG